MSLRRRRGFSLVEVVVVISLTTVLAGTTLHVMVRQNRLAREQRRRADAGATLRAAALIITDELRRLGADSSGSDIVRVGVNAIEYRAVRQWRFVCGVLPGGPALILEREYYGMREVDPARDSLLVYLEPADRWAVLSVRSLSGGTCPNGEPGVTAALASLPPAVATAIVRGAPIRAFEHAELKAYRGGAGRWWIGMRTLVSGRWPSIQPLLGPIAPGGLEIAAFDPAGIPTTSPTRIARIEVLVRAPGVGPRGGGATPSTTVSVTLRNTGS